MFPIERRKLIRGCEAHKRAGLGCAGDYVAYYVLLFAPFKGAVKSWWGWQGGQWLTLTRDNGDKIQFAHLSQYHKRTGEVEEGELLAWTGNTGRLTTDPHLHIQIKDKNGNRLDPENYDWEDSTKREKKQSTTNGEIPKKNMNTKGRLIKNPYNTGEIWFENDGIRDHVGSAFMLQRVWEWGDVTDISKDDWDKLIDSDKRIIRVSRSLIGAITDLLRR